MMGPLRTGTGSSSRADAVGPASLPAARPAPRTFPASFDVKISGGGNRSETLIGINGDLDEALARVLKRTLDRLDPRSVDVIVLDLENVRRVDAAGWRLIVGLQDRCRRAGRELHIRQCGFTPSVGG
jgi:anti-anti-sigma factor